MKAKPVIMYPHMVAQWNTEKNAKRGLDINTTPAGLKVDADWICPKCGHEWVSKISTRKESKGYCPKCDKDKQGPKTKIFISDVPFLMQDWDPDNEIDPTKVSATKKIVVGFICHDCGHKWQANVHTRYYEKTGCPACAGKVANNYNNLLVMVPNIEYYYDKDYPDNPPLESLTVSSSTMVHWKCPDCGHKWNQAPVNRVKKQPDGTYKAGKCAICTGAQIKESYEEEYPEAAYMYSDTNSIPFRELRAKDRNTIFEWDCNVCGYHFESTLGSMLMLINKPHKGCPKCLGKVVPKPGESFADLHPEKAAQCIDDVDLHKVKPNNGKIRNWECDQGHRWQASCSQRHAGWGNCPVCENTRPVRGYNTVEDLFVDVANRWSQNNKYKPYELMPSSSEWVNITCPDCGNDHSVKVSEACAGNEKCPFCSGAKAIPGVNSIDVVYPKFLPIWDYEKNTVLPSNAIASDEACHYYTCSKGHSFMAKNKRLNLYLETGNEPCPYCNGRKVDEAHSVYALFPEYIDNYIGDTDPRKLNPEATTPLEYSCDKGHTFEVSFPYYKECIDTGKEPCPYCDGRQILPGYNDYRTLYPVSANNLDIDKNVGLDFNSISPRSIDNLWFTCEEGHSYFISPSKKIEYESQNREPCPYCDDRQILPGYNDYRTLYPSSANDIDIDKNVGIDFNSISPRSVDNLWFTCKEGHSYFISPSKKIEYESQNREACPYCDDRQILPGYNSLYARNTELIDKCWLWVNNYGMGIDPDEISETSTTPTWWICLKDKEHHYLQSPANRLMFEYRKMNPCPICKGRVRRKQHFVKYIKKE